LISNSFGPAAVGRAGGRAFDIEVNVRDTYASDSLEILNRLADREKDIKEPLDQVVLAYLTSSHIVS
jgi:hypothetical protein